MSPGAIIEPEPFWSSSQFASDGLTCRCLLVSLFLRARASCLPAAFLLRACARRNGHVSCAAGHDVLAHPPPAAAAHLRRAIGGRALAQGRSSASYDYPRRTRCLCVRGRSRGRVGQAPRGRPGTVPYRWLYSGSARRLELRGHRTCLCLLDRSAVLRRSDPRATRRIVPAYRSPHASWRASPSHRTNVASIPELSDASATKVKNPFWSTRATHTDSAGPCFSCSGCRRSRARRLASTFPEFPRFERTAMRSRRFSLDRNRIPFKMPTRRPPAALCHRSAPYSRLVSALTSGDRRDRRRT